MACNKEGDGDSNEGRQQMGGGGMRRGDATTSRTRVARGGKGSKGQDTGNKGGMQQRQQWQQQRCQETSTSDTANKRSLELCAFIVHLFFECCFGGMPGGIHSLLIFGCCFPVLCDEPVEHVEKDSVWLFHADWLTCFTNCF
jgi:hypothetical protein